MIELGVDLPSGGDDFSRERMVRVAELARELGYQHVWAGEHLVADSTTADRGKSLDPFVSLAWVAGRVEGIGIGTSIVLLPMRHPFRVAREAATLQLLSEGRFNLGIGVGWNEAEFLLAGYGFRDRGDRADEALCVIEMLCRAGRVSRVSSGRSTTPSSTRVRTRLPRSGSTGRVVFEQHTCRGRLRRPLLEPAESRARRRGHLPPGPAGPGARRSTR